MKKQPYIAFPVVRRSSKPKTTSTATEGSSKRTDTTPIGNPFISLQTERLSAEINGPRKELSSATNLKADDCAIGYPETRDNETSLAKETYTSLSIDQRQIKPREREKKPVALVKETTIETTESLKKEETPPSPNTGPPSPLSFSSGTGRGWFRSIVPASRILLQTKTLSTTSAALEVDFDDPTTAIEVSVSEDRKDDLEEKPLRSSVRSPIGYPVALPTQEVFVARLRALSFKATREQRKKRKKEAKHEMLCAAVRSDATAAKDSGVDRDDIMNKDTEHGKKGMLTSFVDYMDVCVSCSSPSKEPVTELRQAQDAHREKEGSSNLKSSTIVKIALDSRELTEKNRNYRNGTESTKSAIMSLVDNDEDDTVEVSFVPTPKHRKLRRDVQFAPSEITLPYSEDDRSTETTEEDETVEVEERSFDDDETFSEDEEDYFDESSVDYEDRDEDDDDDDDDEDYREVEDDDDDDDEEEDDDDDDYDDAGSTSVNSVEQALVRLREYSKETGVPIEQLFERVLLSSPKSGFNTDGPQTSPRGGSNPRLETTPSGNDDDDIRRPGINTRASF